ncbi:FAD-binding protein [Microbispora sp. H11081]|uniref:FAD-binding protein n=1 Tax=Microbispora sp. H11081 TaxID=2729107 RepID=UPI0014747244|nr:FAD-binding protein [Microbispora sp. H11081]
MAGSLRIAVLAKQVPLHDDLCLDSDGRLRREGRPLEMNPYCRRAVAKGVETARATGGACTVYTLGPPAAAEVLREAIAWGADDGVLITDPVLAGSDTLATARALAAALRRDGPYDLVVAGLGSVDADTGQVAPQVAELLDLPLLTGVRDLTVEGRTLHARCERDDGHMTAWTRVPAVISVAERSCDPCKVPQDRRAGDDRITVLTSADLGPGPWGAVGSPTRVDEVLTAAPRRAGVRLSGSVERQVRKAVALLAASGALSRPASFPGPGAATLAPPGGTGVAGGVVTVLAETGRERVTRELLSAAAALGADRTVLLCGRRPDPHTAWSWGADEVVVTRPEAEDLATAAALLLADAGTGTVLAPGTTWGREAAARLAARLGAGLVGDAETLETADGRLVCWKSTAAGLARVSVHSPVQLATVRPGVLPVLPPRAAGAAPITTAHVEARGRVTVSERVAEDDPADLAAARVVVGVGQGVDPERYAELKPLLDVLDAELAATRKVTDRGWLPRSRQIGITGRAVAPALYVLLGASGKNTHMSGVRRAGFVLAVNPDPHAPVFSCADAGVVADWAEAVPALVGELRSLTG